MRSFVSTNLSWMPIAVAVAFFAAAAVMAGAGMLMRSPVSGTLIVTPQKQEFGLVRPQVLKCEYSLVNRSSDELELLEPIKACGCTGVRLDKVKLKPGEIAKATCEFDVQGRAGTFATWVSVPSRSTRSGKLDVTRFVAAADVDPWVRVSPPKLEFTTGEAGSGLVQVQVQVQTTDPDNPSIRVTGVAVDHKAFSVSDLESAQSDARQISVVFVPERLGRQELAATLTIETNHPQESRIRIPIVVRSKQRK